MVLRAVRILSLCNFYTSPEVFRVPWFSNQRQDADHGTDHPGSGPCEAKGPPGPNKSLQGYLVLNLKVHLAAERPNPRFGHQPMVPLPGASVIHFAPLGPEDSTLQSTVRGLISGGRGPCSSSPGGEYSRGDKLNFQSSTVEIRTHKGWN